MDLLANPFFVLGATMGDPRRRIMALAEEKLLVTGDATEGAVRDAKAMLTHPKRRLRAEIAWLPGLPPKRISETIAVLQQDPAQVRSLTWLPSLARANLLAAGLIRIAKQLPKGDVAQWILELARVHEVITAEATMTLLNKERAAAAFPAITDSQMVDAELRDQRQYYGQAIKKALDLLSFQSLVEIVTTTVDKATNHGNHQAPILIDDLVDRFEVEAQGFFETETMTIKDLTQRIRQAAKRGKGYRPINRLVSQLEDTVRNWDRVAQPIQLSARSRGTDHDLSHEIAGEIRSLAIDLFNKHDLLSISRMLTALQQVVFAEIPSVAEQLEEDASEFDEIAKARTHNQKPYANDDEEQASLHLAAANGEVETIKELLIAGAQLDAKNQDGLTPLDLAMRNGHAEAVKVLRKAGAQPNTKESAGGCLGFLFIFPVIFILIRFVFPAIFMVIKFIFMYPILFIILIPVFIFICCNLSRQSGKKLKK